MCFVGIGLPSEAANLARATHAPGCFLIYESGTLGAKPDVLPLSIGDGVLAEHADSVVSVPEVFNYWLQAGRVDVGFLGAAQIDRFGNINTTVVGAYDDPKVRLPGAGRRAGDRRLRQGGDHHAPPQAARLRRGAGLRHLGRATARAATPARRLGYAGAGPTVAHHGPRRPQARPGDEGADPRRPPPRRDRRGGEGGDGLGPARSPRRSSTTDPPTARSSPSCETCGRGQRRRGRDRRGRGLGAASTTREERLRPMAYGGARRGLDRGRGPYARSAGTAALWPPSARTTSGRRPSRP